MFIHHAMTSETAPPSFERPIDLVHLARQTLGDRMLEREILGLFVVQAKSVLSQLAASVSENSRMELAHTLKGSSRAVGAWRVASAAEACELAMDSAPSAWLAAVDALTASVREACLAIADVQSTH